MTVTKDRLVKEFTKAIRDGNAAIFAGAGLSRTSGYVDWKTFLKPMAEELGLNIEKETDLLSIAQYYKNKLGNSASINQEILNTFNKEADENKNIEIITRLPISTYWTTNYDQLIEEGLKKENKRIDVKIDSKQLANTLFDRDAIVYKMHGDVDHPADTVLTKDDYVLYDKKRPLFKTILKGDLISKIFLFIGFSFEDPNLDYILNEIHALMDENVRDHYCFFRRVQKSDYANDEDYGYEQAKQELRARDLARYGIQTVFVDDYAEITKILYDIELTIKRNNVFISGSADDYASWGKEKAEELSSEIAKALVKENFKITSGFGLGIGSSVINGALSEIYQSKYKHTDEYLCLRPFPQGIKDAAKRKATFAKYRKDMIKDTGVAIFLFGNKTDPADTSNIINAQGCWDEFEVARDNKDIIIPIGSTGFMAKEIFDEVRANIDDYKYLEKYINILETETEIDELVKTITTILKEQRKIG